MANYYSVRIQNYRPFCTDQQGRLVQKDALVVLAASTTDAQNLFFTQQGITSSTLTPEIYQLVGYSGAYDVPTH